MNTQKALPVSSRERDLRHPVNPNEKKCEVIDEPRKLSEPGEVGVAASATHPTRPNRSVPPLAQPIEASLAKPDLNASTSVSISASVIGVENTHVPVLMMMQPSLYR